MVVYGFGIGGYGGLDEPWGSIEWPLPEGAFLSALNEAYVGIIEATSGIIGEKDNDIGGQFSTRLTSVGTEGDTSINVESTLNWSSINGKITIDGVVYYYANLTDTTINNLYYYNNGVQTSGLAKNHTIYSEVINLNKELSAIDLCRRMLLVDYAEGPYLDVIGRRLGVPRKPLYGDDDLYRAIIKAIAYSPRGTVYGIELVLDALLGAGNYEIYEDLIMHPCEVFIKIADSYFLSDSPVGKTYLSERLYGVTSGSFGTIVLPYAPLKTSFIKLKDLGEVFDFRTQIPSDVEYSYYEEAVADNAFTYAGGLSEANVTQNGYFTTFQAPSSGTVYYDMLDSQGARIDENSIVRFDTTIQIPSVITLGVGLLKQISFSIYDGSKNINIGFDNGIVFGIFETEGAGFYGDSVVLSANTTYDIQVLKNGTENVSLWVNGELITTVSYAAFINPISDHKFSFGLQGTPPSGCGFFIKQIGISIINKTDYWSTTYADTEGSVSTTQPNIFTVAGTHTFSSNDIGKNFEVINSSIVNVLGGNNNIKGVINSVNSSTEISLSPISYSNCTIESNKLFLPSGVDKFKFPDDLGKKVEITNSTLGNNGTYYITGLYAENSLETDGFWINFMDALTPDFIEYTSVARLSGSLTDEPDIEFSKLISFQTESNLGFIHSDSGMQSSDTLTLKDPLWANDLLMEVGISNVLTGQMLLDSDVDNELISSNPLTYRYYPFYLSDVLGSLEGFIDELTIAGVIPSVSGI